MYFLLLNYNIDNENKLNNKLKMLSNLEHKRQSRSKHREKEDKWSSTSNSEMNKVEQEVQGDNRQSIKQRKQSSNRPFSGGQPKPQKNSIRQSKERPKTAKNKIKAEDKEK